MKNTHFYGISSSYRVDKFLLLFLANFSSLELHLSCAKEYKNRWLFDNYAR